MGLRARFKKAETTKNGTLRYPTTVLFDIEQYKIVDQLVIHGCRSFGSKVRHLVTLGLLEETKETVMDRIKDAQKKRESS